VTPVNVPLSFRKLFQQKKPPAEKIDTGFDSGIAVGVITDDQWAIVGVATAKCQQTDEVALDIGGGYAFL
jgi:hypothetical protein